MPFTTDILRVHHRWFVCVLCSWAFVYMTYKENFFWIIEESMEFAIEGKKHSDRSCPFLSNSTSKREPLPIKLPSFFWDSSFIAISDCGFYVGKLSMVVPAGVMSDLGHSKYVLGGGMFLVAISYLVGPTTTLSMYMALDLVEGVGEALVYPSVFALIRSWAPPLKQNFYTALVVAGLYIGDIVAYVLFQFFTLRPKSWENYSTGVIGLVWLVVWSVFMYCSPLADSVPCQRRTSTNRHWKHCLLAEFQRIRRIPWRRIATSLPFISLFLVYSSLNWTGEYVWKTLVPYQEYILHLPRTFNDYSNFTEIAVLPSLLMGGLLADWVMKNDLMSKTVVIRSFVFIGIFISAILEVLLILAGCNVVLYLVSLTTAMYVVGLPIAAIYSSPMHLSPQHTGLLAAILTGGDTLRFLLDVKIGKIFLKDLHNPNDWRNRLLLHSLIPFVFMILFTFFGSGEKQHWKRAVVKHPRPVQQPPAEPATDEERDRKSRLTKYSTEMPN